MFEQLYRVKCGNSHIAFRKKITNIISICINVVSFILGVSITNNLFIVFFLPES